MNDFSMLARPKKYTLDHRVKITAKISLIQLPSTCKGLRPASPSLQLAPATSTRVAMAPPAPWKRHPRPFEAIPWEIPCSDMTPPPTRGPSEQLWIQSQQAIWSVPKVPSGCTSSSRRTPCCRTTAYLPASSVTPSSLSRTLLQLPVIFL